MGSQQAVSGMKWRLKSPFPDLTGPPLLAGFFHSFTSGCLLRRVPEMKNKTG